MTSNVLGSETQEPVAIKLLWHAAAIVWSGRSSAGGCLGYYLWIFVQQNMGACEQGLHHEAHKYLMMALYYVPQYYSYMLLQSISTFNALLFNTSQLHKNINVIK